MPAKRKAEKWPETNDCGLGVRVGLGRRLLMTLNFWLVCRRIGHDFHTVQVLYSYEHQCKRCGTLD